MKTDLAKVGVVGSNPIARSSFLKIPNLLSLGLMIRLRGSCRSSPGHRRQANQPLA